MAPISWQAQLDRALEPVPEEEDAPGAVCLEAGPDTISLLRLSKGVPECVRVAAKGGQICAVVQEPGAATAWVPRSLLPRTDDLRASDGAEEVEPGNGWCALRIGRPGSGKEGLKMPAAPGTAGSLCALLAEVPVNARLLSAFGDVLLIPEEALPQAAAKLVSHGHALWPSTRICDPRPWEAAGERPSEPELAKKLAGAWSLVQREEPPGTVVEDFSDGDGPMRLQMPGGLFIELRVPPGDVKEGKQNSFGGRYRTKKQDGQIVCSQLRAIDFQPPSVEVPEFQVTLSASCLEVVGHPRNEEYRELWAKLGNAEESDFVALELQSEVPEPKVPRCGIWLFAGTRFARLVGLPRGGGLVAGTSCRSLGQLQRLRGSAEVKNELREHYEALYGTVEEPGLLKVRRMAWKPEKTDTVFYSASDDSTGEIVVGQDSILHILPGGRRETWRIVEWTFDPFTSSSAGGDNKSEARSSSPSQAKSEGSDAPKAKSEGSDAGKVKSEGSAKDDAEEEKEDDAEEEKEVKLRSESATRPADSAAADTGEAENRSRSVSSSSAHRRSKKKAAQVAAGAGGKEAEEETGEVATDVEKESTETPPPSPEASPARSEKSVKSAKTRAKAKPKSQENAKEPKEGKEDKEKRKKRRKKGDAAADDESGADSANGKAGKNDKKKKRKKVKKKGDKGKRDETEAEKAEDNAESENKAPAPQSDAEAGEARARTSSPAAPSAASSPKAAGSPKPQADASAPASPAPASPAAASDKGTPAAKSAAPASPAASSEPGAQAKRSPSPAEGGEEKEKEKDKRKRKKGKGARPAPASPAAASDKGTPAAKSTAPPSPAASSEPGSKRSPSPAGGGEEKEKEKRKKKKDKGARNAFAAAGGKRQKSKERGRKKERKASRSPKRSSPKRGTSAKREASPKKRKSSRSPRQSSPTRKRDASKRRSPDKRRGRSGSRKGGSRSRKRGGDNARGNKGRSNSGRRNNRGDRARSRSRSRSDRKKRRR